MLMVEDEETKSSDVVDVTVPETKSSDVVDVTVPVTKSSDVVDVTVPSDVEIIGVEEVNSSGLAVVSF